MNFLRFFRLFLLIATVALLWGGMPLATQAQTIRYVSPTGTNTNPATATSWATSTTDLQEAINASAANDQVWVKVGIYKPTSTTPGTPADRTISFAMRNGVAIYGGFAGIETNLSNRPAINLTTPSSTTLSSDIGAVGNTIDNSFHVISNPVGLTNTAVLDGFVITGGNANGSFPDNAGGGIFNSGRGSGNVCSPTLRRCLFQNNTAVRGGAINNDGTSGTSSPVLTNCVLFGNGGANTFFNETASISATYSLFDASVTGYTSGPGNLTTTTLPFSSPASTQLATNSPAINAGDPATTSATVGNTDLAGNPRFVNNRIDMGATEFQGILEVFSLKDGLWNDATLWSVGRLPLAGERVRLKHAVTMPGNFTGQSGTPIYDPNSRLIYELGGRLQMGQ